MTFLDSNAHNPDIEDWEKILEAAEDKTGLEIIDHIDDIEIVKYNLPRNVPAATQNKENNNYKKSKILFNNDAKYLPQTKKEEVAIHEAIHVLDHKNRLIPELEEKKQVSEKFRKEIQRNLLHGDRNTIEGTTQLITSHLAGNKNSNYFYPYETNKVSQKLENQGIDVSFELADEIKDFEDEILNHYTEIYEVNVRDNFYEEIGSLGRRNYELHVYGENIAFSYLKNRGEEY